MAIPFFIGKTYQQPNFGGDGVSPPAGVSPAFLGLPGRSAADCGAVASPQSSIVCPTFSVLRQRFIGDWLFALSPILQHFKAINDKWGHHTGDTILIAIARLLSNRLRNNDHIFRIGGEEFMVLLPETSLPDAETLARELVRSVAAETFHTGIGVTISGGLTQACANENWSAWLKRADQALYKAKSDGRNRVVQLPRHTPPADTSLRGNS